MSKKIIVLGFSILNLLFSQLGTAFGKVKATVSTPIVLSSDKDKTTDNDDLAYGDKYFNQITFPYDLEFIFGYIYAFDNYTSLLGFWKVKYSDDPLNSIFSGRTEDKEADKEIIPDFTEQNINNVISFNYTKQFSFFDLSLGTLFNFDLYRETPEEDFLDGIDNNYFVAFNTQMSFDVSSQVQLKPKVAYFFNYYPNDRLGSANDSASANVIAVPTILKDYHKVDVGLDLAYRPLENLVLSIGYVFTADIYPEYPILDGNLESNNYTSKNKLNIKNKVNLDVLSFFFKRRDYYLLTLKFSYLFRNNSSNYIEVLNISSGQEGDLATRLSDPSFAQAVPIGSGTSYIVLREDYENFIYNSLGIYPSFKFHSLYSLNLGYSFVIKNYTNHFARYGDGEKVEVPHGAYKDENRVDMTHNLFISFVIYNKSKNFSFTPYFGMRFSSSNDFTRGLNNDIYYLGFTTNLEF